MALKDLYESWAFKPLAGAGSADTPRTQSEGDVKVDFLQNTYTKNDTTNRTPGDTVVTQAVEDNTTAGEFNSDALGYYSSLVSSPLKAYKSKVIHKYNSNSNQKYLDSTQTRNSPGALYISLGNDTAQ